MKITSCRLTSLLLVSSGNLDSDDSSLIITQEHFLSREFLLRLIGRLFICKEICVTWEEWDPESKSDADIYNPKASDGRQGGRGGRRGAAELQHLLHCTFLETNSHSYETFCLKMLFLLMLSTKKESRSGLVKQIILKNRHKHTLKNIKLNISFYDKYENVNGTKRKFYIISSICLISNIFRMKRRLTYLETICVIKKQAEVQTCDHLASFCLILHIII